MTTNTTNGAGKYLSLDPTDCAHQAIRLMLEDGHDFRQLSGFGHVSDDDDQYLTVQDVSDGNLYISDACDLNHDYDEPFGGFEGWVENHANTVVMEANRIVATTEAIGVITGADFWLIGVLATRGGGQFPVLECPIYEVSDENGEWAVVLLGAFPEQVRADLEEIEAATGLKGRVLGEAMPYDLNQNPLWPLTTFKEVTA